MIENFYIIHTFRMLAATSRKSKPKIVRFALPKACNSFYFFLSPPLLLLFHYRRKERTWKWKKEKERKKKYVNREEKREERHPTASQSDATQLAGVTLQLCSSVAVQLTTTRGAHPATHSARSKAAPCQARPRRAQRMLYAAKHNIYYSR